MEENLKVILHFYNPTYTSPQLSGLSNYWQYTSKLIIPLIDEGSNCTIVLKSNTILIPWLFLLVFCGLITDWVLIKWRSTKTVRPGRTDHTGTHTAQTGGELSWQTTDTVNHIDRRILGLTDHTDTQYTQIGGALRPTDLTDRPYILTEHSDWQTTQINGAFRLARLICFFLYFCFIALCEQITYWPFSYSQGNALTIIIVIMDNVVRPQQYIHTIIIIFY